MTVIKSKFYIKKIATMEINEKIIIKKAVDDLEEKIWRKLQDLNIDSLKDKKDKEYIVRAVLQELLDKRVWNILSMLK